MKGTGEVESNKGANCCGGCGNLHEYSARCGSEERVGRALALRVAYNSAKVTFCERHMDPAQGSSSDIINNCFEKMASDIELLATWWASFNWLPPSSAGNAR